jgi:hypothetical protein
MKSWRVKETEHVACMMINSNTYSIFWKNLISRYTWEDDIKNILKECEQKDVDWIVWPCTWANGMNLQVP